LVRLHCDFAVENSTDDLHQINFACNVICRSLALGSNLLVAADGMIEKGRPTSGFEGKAEMPDSA